MPAASSRSMVVPLIVACALFMQNLDGTIITTALPAMAESFGDTAVRLSLGITAYMLSLAIFIPVSGWVADRYGPAQIFRIAIGVFTLGSILCGFSNNLGQLTGARIVQGLGGAMMVPVGRLVILRSIDRTELVRAISYLTTPAILGPILGPPVGGFITTYFSWRWVFFLNLPIGVLGILLVTFFIKDLPKSPRTPLDWLGFILTGAALTCLMYGLGLVANPAVGGATIAIMLGIGAALGVLAVLHAKRHTRPLIDLSLLRLPTFAANISGGTLYRVSAGGLPFLLPLMLQLGFGMTAFASGLITFAGGAGSLLNKMSTGPILRRFGYRNTFLANSVIVAGFIFSYALFTPATSFLVMFLLLLFGGYFRSLQFTALNSLAFVEVPQAKVSSATAFSSMMQELSNGMGVAVGAILLHLAQLWRGAEAGLTPADFHVALVMVGLVSLSTLWFFAQLAPDSGAEVTGHRPRAARAAVKDTAGD